MFSNSSAEALHLLYLIYRTRIKTIFWARVIRFVFRRHINGRNFGRQNCWVMTADRTEPLGRKIIFLFPLYGASNMWTASASNPDGTGGEGGKTRRSPPVFTETPLTSVSHGWPGVKGAGVAGGHGPAPVITATCSSGVSTAAFSQVAGG